MKRRVVVTGMGVVTAISCQVDDLWQQILAGASGVHLVRLCDTSDLKVKIGGDIYDWDPSAYIDPKEAKRIDRFTQFALVAGTDAIRDSRTRPGPGRLLSLRRRAGFGHRRAV